MGNDFSGIAAGIGVGAFLIGLVLYLAILALTLWIGYLIMRTAVKNGVLRADEELARRGRGFPVPPQRYAPPPGR